MKIAKGRNGALTDWSAVDALQFWLRSVAQWLWQPPLRWAAYIFHHGVPPPPMVFPDSRKDRTQFPPLCSLGFILPSASALQLWDEGAHPDKPLIDPAPCCSAAPGAKSRPSRPAPPSFGTRGRG